MHHETRVSAMRVPEIANVSKDTLVKRAKFKMLWQHRLIHCDGYKNGISLIIAVSAFDNRN